MDRFQFPPFVHGLPEAEIAVAGLRGWILQSDLGQMVFNQADVEIVVPEHSHGYEWGVVLDGRIDFIIGGQRHSYTRGDSYSIPAGTVHAAQIYAGFRSVDYFGDPAHYRARG